jgi:hypothetical protein
MGHPDGAHTHGSGGGGAGTAVLVVLAAAVVAGPVMAAAAELAHLLLIAVAVILGLGGAGVAACVAWRLHQGRANRVTAVSFPRPLPPRAGESLPGTRPALERPAVHLHLHGVSAEDIAVAIRQAQREAGD